MANESQIESRLNKIIKLFGVSYQSRVKYVELGSPVSLGRSL